MGLLNFAIKHVSSFIKPYMKSSVKQCTTKISNIYGPISNPNGVKDFLKAVKQRGNLLVETKSENIFMPNYLMNSNDSNNNIKKYEMARNGPMQKITEVDQESEETFQNEEPKFYDEYDEQYVKNFFLLIFYFREILFVGIAKLLLLEEKHGKMLHVQNAKKLIKFL